MSAERAEERAGSLTAREGWRRLGAVGFLSCGLGNCRHEGGLLEEAPTPPHALVSVGCSSGRGRKKSTGGGAA